MAKTFTDKPLHQHDQVKTDNLTANLDKTLDQLNGGLDSNNMPVKSVGYQKLQPPTYLSGVGGSIEKFSIEMPSQSYHKSENSNRTRGTSIYDPIFALNLDASNWNAGFNELSSLDSAFDDFPVSFDAREGMLTGCLTIDWEHGNNVFNVDTGVDDGEGGTIFAARGRGNEWWSEWQVYVNNVAVARTGWIFPRRHTTQLPFAVACGSQPVTITARCRINTWWVSGGPSLEQESTAFKVFSANLWVRNQYR